MSEAGHISVLLNEAVAALPLEQGMWFVDGTLGGGGHAEAILRASKGRLLGIDKDEAAILRSKERLAQFGERVTYVHDDFVNIKNIVAQNGNIQIDGAVLDLGVSSYQLDESDRGFSYNKEAPIDMRMDKSASFSANDIVNHYSEEELKRIIYTYGEERFGGRIASAIVKNRPINSTLQLAEIIKHAIPAANRRTGPHPARRTFQAIRIETNAEISNLQAAVEDFIDCLAPQGRLSIITFHSLEDRIVKNVFRTAQDPCTCPKDIPICVCGKKTLGTVITRKPIMPSAEEVKNNPRARSAKLRVFEKINNG